MNLFNVFKFIGEKNPNYTLDLIQEKYLFEKPYPGEGYYDNIGKQGLWVVYYSNGVIYRKSFYKDDLSIGKSIFYNQSGNVIWS